MFESIIANLASKLIWATCGLHLSFIACALAVVCLRPGAMLFDLLVGRVSSCPTAQYSRISHGETANSLATCVEKVLGHPATSGHVPPGGSLLFFECLLWGPRAISVRTLSRCRVQLLCGSMSAKLRGIYDAVDHGQWKTAVKLCEAMLKKQPGHILCKALNAVALERCGRREEAIHLCDETRISPECDDVTFSTLQVVYRRCRRGEEVMRMYEIALSKSPDNETYATSLFVHAMSCQEFAKAQQVATKLYSKHKRVLYLQWAVASMLLQGGKLLDLAEMMLKKAPLEPVQTFDRRQQHLLLLHLATLRAQSKYEQALTLLGNFSHLLPFGRDVREMRIQLLLDSGDVKEAARESRQAVISSKKNWSTLQEYMRLAFRCSPNSEVTDHCSRLCVPAEFSVEDLDVRQSEDEVTNAFVLFRCLELEAGGNSLREPLLAQLELLRMAMCANESTMSGSWRDAVPADHRAKLLERLRANVCTRMC